MPGLVVCSYIPYTICVFHPTFLDILHLSGYTLKKHGSRNILEDILYSKSLQSSERNNCSSARRRINVCDWSGIGIV